MEANYDSILTATDTNVINTTQYYKLGKGMPDHGIPVVENSYVVAQDDFLIGGMLLMLFIMSLVIHNSGKVLFTRFAGLFSRKRTYSNENVNDNENNAQSLFCLISICALSLSLVQFDYISKQCGFSEVVGVPYWLFAAGYVFVMLFVYAKAWLYAMVGWTFFDHDVSVKWLSGYLLITALASIFICPISVLVVLDVEIRYFVNCAFVFVLVLYEILLLFKMFVNFKSKSYGYLLIFLYFCSVELIPILVVSRATRWIIDSFIVNNLLY